MNSAIPNLVSVEFPGKVVSIEKALETLGGRKELEKLECEGSPVNLRFRPNDPFCHPIIGDFVPTNNLLIKLIKTVKLDENGNEFIETTHEIMGKIIKTCRFKSLADFQYSPNPSNPLVQFRHDLHDFDLEKIDKFNFNIETKGNVDNLLTLPPPAFSRVEWPLGSL